VLIEADGSHLCPLKAPTEHEPAIPEFSQIVVVVAGLVGLEKPLGNKWVHRPQKFSELSGLRMGDLVTRDALVKVMLNKAGGLKNIPSNARRMVLLNQADTPELQSAGKSIGNKLIPDYHSVIIASLAKKSNVEKFVDSNHYENREGIHAVIEQIGGIILAAGGSSRFGEPKQLLIWKGVPLIRHVAKAAFEAGLSPVIIVVGAAAEEVKSAVKDLPVRIVNNLEWAAGMSGSIKAGLIALPIDIGGVVFMQADQPQIPPALIRSLVEVHEATLTPIIAPQIDGQRGNPVLFDSSTFTKLLSLEGDIGGRAIFGQYQVRWVPWHDANILLDIDSPEDYQKFLSNYPENGAKV
jgi:molybdenum cofactor cytidylyltransferase